jgi:hypothetical protein
MGPPPCAYGTRHRKPKPPSHSLRSCSGPAAKPVFVKSVMANLPGAADMRPARRGPDRDNGFAAGSNGNAGARRRPRSAKGRNVKAGAGYVVQLFPTGHDRRCETSEVPRREQTAVSPLAKSDQPSDQFALTINVRSPVAKRATQIRIGSPVQWPESQLTGQPSSPPWRFLAQRWP